MVSKKFKAPLYNHIYKVYIVSDPQEMEDELYKRYGVDVGDLRFFDGMHIWLQKPSQGTTESVLVFMSNIFDKKQEPGYLENVIAHECLHLAWYIIGNVGIHVTADNHEAQTYLLGELVQTVTNFLNKHKDALQTKEQSD
jgi:hypothetical protein